MSSGFIQLYFNLVYNRIYDATTARLKRYSELQNTCIEKLGLRRNDRVLCVGVGTGNEIKRLIEKEPTISLVGIDYSSTALKKAAEKAARLGATVQLLQMDAFNMDLPPGSFDKLLCFHVMDFIVDQSKLTLKLMDVLRDGGSFVISYPSKTEGVSMAARLAATSESGQGTTRGVRRFLACLRLIPAGILYLPLLFRSKRRPYSREELKSMFSSIIPDKINLLEDGLYQDFIVWGEKTEVKTNAA